MDKHICNDFVETLTNLLKNKCPSVCKYRDDVLLEYRPRNHGHGNPGDGNASSPYWACSKLESGLNQFLDIAVNGPVVIAHKGKTREFNIENTLDISNNARQQRIRQSDSSTGSRFSDTVRLSSNESTSLSSDNLDGSPLKLQAFADLSCFESPSSVSSLKYTEPVPSTEKKDYGICARQARCMLSMFAANMLPVLRDNKHIGLVPDFWILCDASDIKSTIIMGAQQVLVDGIVAGLRTITVTLSNDADIKKAEQKFKRMTSTATDAQCYARYHGYSMTGSTTDERSDNERTDYQGSLSVDFEWKRTTSLMQQPPFHAAAFIKASVCSGDIRSPIYSFFQELTILKNFVSGVSTGDVNWTAEHSDVPLIDSVKALIEQLKQAGRIDEVASEDDKETDDVPPSLHNRMFKERQDLDFTDRLWKVLITCSSYSDLVQSLQFVFNSLSSGQLFPMVHSTNHTTLAQLVRDSYTGRMIVPGLKGIIPMKLLAEIGAQKLKKDYMNAFVSTNLTTLSLLTQLGSETTPTLDVQVTRLERQQAVLEMVSMLKMFLRLPLDSLGAIARQMLKHYETNHVDDDYVFEFSVATSSVASITETSSPCVWKARFDLHTGPVSESTVYCMTSDLPFTHVQSKFHSEPSGENTSETRPQFFMKKQEYVTLF